MSKSVVATDKKRISVYLDEDLKLELEKLSKTMKRSLSNLIEITCQERVDKAKKSGEID